ncbi:unnamed protein product [Mytilus edulis]|uniref:Uncharacterized protein n=1 Tax=Mytilus edulis TaxID=6550 RepID=A0A8S3VGC9_MYTED|nr:unnamed protein product [Mytilus edulis]
MPKKCNIGRTVMADFNEFARKLRCRFHFGNTESRGMHPFRQKSFYEPTPACFELENYLDLTKFELSNLDLRNNYYNFTKEQQLGLRSLKNMQDIIFSKSDKGGAIVISKKTHYIKEGLRQLNSIHYTEIQEPNLLLIKNNIQTQISKMFDNGEIDGITLDFLRGSSKEGPRLGRLFLLPKLHKLSELVIQGIKKQNDDS